MPLHFLTDEEERSIKRRIPWESIDIKARELVRFANETKGVATLQSCAGHIELLPEGSFGVTHAHLAFRATEIITTRVLFYLAPEIGILDVSLRYFDSGSFWICISVDSGERWLLYEVFRRLQEEGGERDTDWVVLAASEGAGAES